MSKGFAVDLGMRSYNPFRKGCIGDMRGDLHHTNDSKKRKVRSEKERTIREHYLDMAFLAV